LKPSFFLHAKGEYDELADPRPCWEIRRLRDDVRDDYMLVRVEPPLVGQRFGLGPKNVDQLILASRVAGYTLYPISSWPCPVYVWRLRHDDGVSATGSFSSAQVELIAWGLIFDTIDKARRDAEALVF
jgi:hypothetical protein